MPFTNGWVWGRWVEESGAVDLEEQVTRAQYSLPLPSSHAWLSPFDPGRGMPVGGSGIATQEPDGSQPGGALNLQSPPSQRLSPITWLVLDH